MGRFVGHDYVMTDEEQGTAKALVAELDAGFDVPGFDWEGFVLRAVEGGPGVLAAVWCVNVENVTAASAAADPRLWARVLAVHKHLGAHVLGALQGALAAR